MSKFDGTKDPLEYGQALVELAKRVPFGSEEERAEVVHAIQDNHGLLPPEPDPEEEEAAALAAGADPKDAELRRLRAQLAARDAEDAKKDAAAEKRRAAAEKKTPAPAGT